MNESALSFISSILASAGINYEFGEWKSDIVYPYFVGEYQETENMNEDGKQEGTLILNGFTKGSWLELEQAKKTIESLFPSVGGNHTITQNGGAVAVFYSYSNTIPTGDAQLKRIEIYIRVLTWGD